ncbi:dihydrodipicolinate synthase family protein [Trichococcus pasteurii]|uniref:Dihydrodipicolinate synthase signature n=1 Tax=Trichococcus pasteurii TaxID=43064 RepID=A0A1W1IFR7_9LACT|nr:dihydrodipicolinate synthase family protein [Trichococcus pasteurii]SFE58835.1 4-hydroxy-tetrahydrodipicolinate synthase [Trichococcus pasteurii]SLM51864.1 dihydrodipicolinate synthase signature [Trichococcus pasteurii]SSB92745.1 dihydrodipicolinate synthase signature [Trichococcus pasteurii]
MFDLVNDFHIAVPTAFYENEDLNTEATLQHIRNLYDQGVKSVLVCGTTGEQHSLSLAEKLQLLESLDAASFLPDDLEILFGVASIRQKEALQLAEKVNANPKISGVLLGFPPYILPSQKEAKLYVEAIAKVINKPIILYNNPRRTGFNLELDTFAELIKLANIIGIKDAGDSARVPELVSVADKKIYIYAGGEIDLDKKIVLGANRLSSMAGNLYPTEVEAYFTGLLRGRADETKNARIEEKIRSVFAENPISYIKNEITKQMNIDMGVARSPLGNQ